MLLTAFEALIEHEHAAADRDRRRARPRSRRYLADPASLARIDALGRVADDELWRRLHEADLLCAPSLAGESFGMVLTEAFAAGTPVLASNIAGYADVVTDGVDGVLVPPADPQRLAEELQALSLEPRAAGRDGRAPRASSGRSATPGRASRPRSRASTSGRRRCRSRQTASERIARRIGLDADRRLARGSARSACPRSIPRRRAPRAAIAPRAGSALGVAGDRRARAHLHRRSPDRRRPRRRQHRPLRRRAGSWSRPR